MSTPDDPILPPPRELVEPYKPYLPRWLWTCNRCGGVNVWLRRWVNPNTGEWEEDENDLEGYDEEHDSYRTVWCNDCRCHSNVSGDKVTEEEFQRRTKRNRP